MCPQCLQLTRPAAHRRSCLSQASCLSLVLPTVSALQRISLIFTTTVKHQYYLHRKDETAEQGGIEQLARGTTYKQAPLSTPIHSARRKSWPLAYPFPTAEENDRSFMPC